MRVDVPSAVLKGTSLTAEVRFAQRGLGGTKVQLLVEDDGRVVQSQEIQLPEDGESGAARHRPRTRGKCEGAGPAGAAAHGAAPGRRSSGA